MTVRDNGDGMIEMVPEIEYVDEMTDTDREWVLQVPDKDVTWTVNMGDGKAEFSEPCMLAPTLSKGWFELLTRRDLAIPLEKDKKLSVNVYASWNTTKGEPRTQTIARGWFSVPGHFHTMGAPVMNVFMPGRVLLSVHVALVNEGETVSLRAVAASVRAKLDESPFDDEEV